MRQIRWLGLAAMIFATLAMAQTLPEEVITQNGVSYVSGGIGIDSQERLKAREKEFNLKLVFSLVEGNYLADVGVTIKDGAGKTVIQHVADGPFFMAKLPAGTYSVSAVYEGKTQTRKVSIRDGRLRTEYVRWLSNPEVDLPVLRRLLAAAQPVFEYNQLQQGTACRNDECAECARIFS